MRSMRIQGERDAYPKSRHTATINLNLLLTERRVRPSSFIPTDISIPWKRHGTEHNIHMHILVVR